MTPSTGEILDGLWRFEARHPEWTEEEDWDPIVAWWAVRTPAGLVLVDPLVTDWKQLDGIVAAEGGCAGVVRMIHWHQRNVSETAERYRVPVLARPPATAEALPEALPAADRALADGEQVAGGVTALSVERADEIALWLEGQRALVFADAMLRRAAGRLTVCPDSWTQPPGGPERLRAVLAALERLPVEHVLVSHGPLVLHDGAAALPSALRR